MRNIFLALLLANFLVFVWQRWIVPPEIERPDVDPLATGQPLRLVARADGPAPVEDDEPGTCFRLGPFTREGGIRSLVDLLSEQGHDVREDSREGQIWVGHWVQLADLPGPEAAEDALDRLIAAGIVDAYVVSTSPAYKISLGVFRNRDGAENAAGVAGRLGLEALMVDRFRSGMEYWLTVAVDRGRELDLAGVTLDGGQILRTEPVACDAPLPADGGTAGD